MEIRCERCQEILPLPTEGVATGGELACPRCGHRQGAGAAGEGTLDDELGAAFDSMLQTGEESAPAAPADPSASEWYVAIEGQQVGPVSFGDLQERWARGVIGADSLCWRAGLPDWVAIGSLPELMEALPPAPPIPTRAEGSQAVEAPEASAAPPAAEPPATEEPDWNPSAARALESLVEKEMEEAEKRQEEGASDPAVPDPETTGIRVVLRDLPEAPPPEPSKFIPIPKSVPAPAPAPAPKPAPAARPKRPQAPAAAPRKESRLGLYALIAAALLLGGGALVYFGGFLPGAQAPEAPEPPAMAAIPPPVEPEKAPPADEPEEERAASDAEEAHAEAEATEAEELEAADEGEVGEAEAQVEAEAAAAEPAPARVAKGAPAKAPAKKPAARPAKKAAARPAASPPSKPKAAPARPTKKAAPKPAASGVLAAGNSSSIDSLFEKEMSSPPPAQKKGGSQPYIPPPPGSGVQRPQKLGQGDIMGVVRKHRSALRGCATRYKEQGGGSGSVTMSWVIEPDGRTSSVRAAKGKEHAGMVRCLEELIEGWKFPSYSGPKMEAIEFPFQF